MEAHQQLVFFSPLQRRSENPEVLHYSTTFPDKSWVGLEQNYSITRSSVRFMRSYCVWWSLEDLAICSKIGWSILGVSWQKSWHSWQNSWEQPIHSGVFPAVHGWFVFVGADWNLRFERARNQVFYVFFHAFFSGFSLRREIWSHDKDFWRYLTTLFKIARASKWVGLRMFKKYAC